jgi:hypothetical protein
MKGHENIIALRMQGHKPKIVFLNDYPCETDWFEHGDQATVCTHHDFMGSLDLRFLVGLTVSISATSESRAKALFERVKQAGAGVVAACHVKPDKHQFDQDGWMQIFRKEAA